MSLLNRLRPKWQNSDPDVRADAVRQLGKDDVELLTAVAQGDTDPRVRRIAVKKLDSPRLLLEIADTDEDEALARFARRRAHQLLVDIACDDRDVEESKRALGLLEETRYVVAVVDKARFEDVRQMAFESLKDDVALAELVCRGKDPEWRSKALERVTSPGALRTIALDENASEFQSAALSKIEEIEVLQSIVDHPSAAKPIRRQAMSKVEQVAPPDHPVHVKKRQEHFEKLASQAEALIESADLERAEVAEELRRDWDEISKDGVAEAELAERFKLAIDALAAARKKLESSAPAPDESKKEAAPAESQVAAEARAAVCVRLESLEGTGLESNLETARIEWNSLAAQAGPPSKEIDRRFRRAVKRIEERIKKRAESAEELAEKEARLNELVERAEALSESADLDEAAREWKRLSLSKPAKGIPSDHPLAARLSGASERFQARLAERSAAHELEQRKTLERLEEIMSRVQELIRAESFSIKEADRAHREAQDFLKTMGPLPKEVSRKKARKKLMEAREALVKRAGEFKELENWKRWANEDIQASLIRRMEALRESSDLPKIAKEMRRIHEEWKQAGSAPLEKAEELWHRYKSIRDELKAKCDEFFEKQNQERAGNLAKKEALCEKVEALQDSENWTEATDEIKKLQAEWKATGPAPQKHSEAIWKRFRKACDHFFERRNAHFGELKDERDENLNKKREICEKAESIKDSTDWHQTANELKRLQAEWRTIGAVPRKHSDQIWKRFRGACDYFFDRFKRRDEVEQEERLKHREALVVGIETLAGAEGSNPEAVAEQTQTLWTDWRKLGPLSDQDQALFERFETAMHSVLSSAPGAFAGTDLDPSASRKRRTKLCEQLESVVKKFRFVTQPFEQPLEDLAARLKDALASNTMTGGQRREKRTDWRTVSREADKIHASWLRTAPVPGEEGRALLERFEAARRELAELAAEGTSPRPEPVASGPDQTVQ